MKSEIQLNQRQQKTLIAIYHSDQETEANEKANYRLGRAQEKSSVWHRMQYPDEYGGETTLHRYLRQAGVISRGLGATLNVLEKYKLIDCSYYFTVLSERKLLTIQLTTKGRKLARNLLGVQVPKRRPKGQLKERQWEALEFAYEMGDEGIKRDEWINYGGFSWQWTILRLRDYYGLGNGLVEEKPYYEKHTYSDGSTYSEKKYKLVITEKGKKYYRENQEMYMQLYPNLYIDVEAPKV